MKLGAENKKEVIALVVLLLIAAPAVLYALHSIWGKRPDAASASRPPAFAPAHKRASLHSTSADLDTTLRSDLLEAAGKIGNHGPSRNIFRMQQPEAQKIGFPMKPVGSQAATPQSQALPPVIPLKYFGFSNRPGEARKAFLSEGSDIFVAHEGEVVDRHYKILQITNTIVMIEDVLNNTRQQIPLSTSAAAG